MRGLPPACTVAMAPGRVPVHRGPVVHLQSGQQGPEFGWLAANFQNLTEEEGVFVEGVLRPTARCHSAASASDKLAVARGMLRRLASALACAVGPAAAAATASSST